MVLKIREAVMALIRMPWEYEKYDALRGDLTSRGSTGSVTH